MNVELLEGRPCFGPCFLHCIAGGFFATIAAAALASPVALWVTCVSCYACVYRTEIRAKYRLAERPMGDCCTHFLCHPCAICQEHRELKSRPGPTSNLDFYGGGGDVQLTAPAVSDMQAVGKTSHY